MPKLLLMAVLALARMLKHRDWRARDSAITKIMTLHGPVLQHLIARLHQVRGEVPGSTEVMELDDFRPEDRDRARELLTLARLARPPRMLPPGLTSQPDDTR
jgi:hypothetical protein